MNEEKEKLKAINGILLRALTLATGLKAEDGYCRMVWCYCVVLKDKAERMIAELAGVPGVSVHNRRKFI
jgi:hypothetical protein